MSTGNKAVGKSLQELNGIVGDGGLGVPVEVVSVAVEQVGWNPGVVASDYPAAALEAQEAQGVFAEVKQEGKPAVKQDGKTKGGGKVKVAGE